MTNKPPRLGPVGYLFDAPYMVHFPPKRAIPQHYLGLNLNNERFTRSQTSNRLLTERMQDEIGLFKLLDVLDATEDTLVQCH